jgi:hypothetical protein
MKNILIIAFHPYDDNMYPHLKVFIDLIGEKVKTKYFFFHERGYSFNNYRKMLNPFFYYLLFKDVFNLRRILYINNFDKIIVVDHFAFAILSFFSLPEKIIFWSHDIISCDNKYFFNPIVKLVIARNKKILRKGSLLLIQDENRKYILENALRTNITSEQIFYMPVFLEDISEKRMHAIKSIFPILMQCGGCGAYRYTDKLIEQYQKDTNYSLYLHGFIFFEIKKQLNKMTKKPILSEKRVSSENIYTVIEKCDIGFVGYTDEDLNFKYISKASGQAVEFLKMAKPIISIGNNDLGKFLEENSAGIEIRSFDMLSRAITNIVLKYEDYSRNALKCFKKYFDSCLYIDKLLEWINK